ncbi:MAG: tripartite tricarboxylate transporter substrate binding protein [Xanthobacteraceae bacterium]
MRFPRRNVLRMAAAGAAIAAMPRIASAQSYPTRPVRLIVGGTPGSAPDVIARLMAQWLSGRLGQSVFVENKNGASDNLATQAVVDAVPDGYTLLLASASNAINATLFANLKFNFIRDIAPISGVVTFPMVVTVNAAFPAKSFPELLAYAKAHPGKINIGTPPLGSPQHVAGELLKMMSGADIVFVAYRGGPAAINDALSGQIQGAIGTVLLTLPQIRSGGLRALAVTSTTPSALLPEIPPVDRVVPGFEAGQWVGMGVPRGTPVEIVERLNREINAGLADATLKTRIAELGGVPLPGSPADFGKFVAAETKKWGDVITFAKIKPE